jgi:hypothetical protein
VPTRLRRAREKVFGPGKSVRLDRNAAARIKVYVRGYNARNKRPRQHCGPITRTFQQVLEALLWFSNHETGACYPSYEAIAGWMVRTYGSCDRSTAIEAINALELAGVVSLQNRLVRVRERCRDLFGREGWCWRVIRTSNAYVFRDPKPPAGPVDSTKSENPAGTLNQDSSLSLPVRRRGPEAKKERYERGAAALAECLRAAAALPDLLKARVRVMEARLRAK